jgi:hypothetical protein
VLSIHESLSSFVAEWFGLSGQQTLFARVHYQDFAEIGLSLLFGLLVLFLTAIAYLREDSKVRTTFRHFISCLLLLVFFGVVADFIDRLFSRESYDILLGIAYLVEDRGK